MIRSVLCLWVTLGFGLSLQAASPFFQTSSDDNWVAVHGSATVDRSVHQKEDKSLRLEASGTDSDASARSKDLLLRIGKTYEVSGWVRTEGLQVKDAERSPIAAGAALKMESMPFDVHSVSVGGSQDWTRLSLRFVATKAKDHILLTAGNGGVLQGKAWFERVSLDEVSADNGLPAPRDCEHIWPRLPVSRGGMDLHPH